MRFHLNQLRELKKGLLLRKYDLMDRLAKEKYETFEEKEQIITAIDTDKFLLECLEQWESNLGVGIPDKAKEKFKELFKADS